MVLCPVKLGKAGTRAETIASFNALIAAHSFSLSTPDFPAAPFKVSYSASPLAVPSLRQIVRIHFPELSRIGASVALVGS